MSKRRKSGDWVWLAKNAGFVGESNRSRAQIQPENNPDSCCLCNDKFCKEWATLWTEPDPKNNNKSYVLCHVSECQMFDKSQL